MRVGVRPIAAGRAAAVQAIPVGSHVTAADTYQASANDVQVVSFNVAGGASAFKRESALLDTQLFQKLITGAADAPIVACQETTPNLAKALIAASKNGNFQVIWPGHSWLPKWLPTSTLMQGNMVLVPKRYQVQQVDARTFKGRAGKFWEALKGLAFHGGKANDLLLAMQNRGYVSVQLADRKTGKSFTVVDTHIAYQDAVRRVETPQLVDAVKRAEAKGPTVLMGDFNTSTPEPGAKLNPDAAAFWQALEPLGLQDVGPTGKAGGSFWRNGENIDAVLAKGFQGKAHEMLSGAKMTLPGHPDAKEVSDHYAEADTLQFS
ncbi:MAG: hypothetical protein JWM80_1873 [Cyanobacteria bacterium RYN_339]|nr:hypothetical protein [Cyanobacteria bacterium RYN_339]